MTAEYLERMSLFLPLESAGRERNICRYSKAEKQLSKLCVAFDYINYSRYMSFQHVLLQHHHEVFQQLHERGFVGSSSSENFSSIHGDLIAEMYNGKNKRHCRPIEIRI